MNSTGTVAWGLVDFDPDSVATNATVITPVGDTPSLSGDYLVVGLPLRFAYSGTGAAAWSAVLNQGNYRLDVEGQTFLDPIYISVPGDSGSYGLADIRLSGGNTFAATGVRKLTSNDGSVTISPANGVGVVDVSASTGPNTDGVFRSVTSASASFSGGLAAIDDAGNIDCAAVTVSDQAHLTSNGDLTCVTVAAATIDAVTIQSRYIALDGTEGITATQTFKDAAGATKTLSIKNGLIVGIA